ncbi:MAG: hypothetical protein H0T89_06410 [Deltaproteobacteria bacterium]|nr:hypothetical protein [Deltaproteobacteria bacterium]MDQ3295333.1 hypothetical protein [Myxococcota bacterium]
MAATLWRDYLARNDANRDRLDGFVGRRWQRVKRDRAVGLLVPHALWTTVWNATSARAKRQVVY